MPFEGLFWGGQFWVCHSSELPALSIFFCVDVPLKWSYVLFWVVCIVSAQKFDKDRLYTKIDQHRFRQNTKTWGRFFLPVPYKSWATFYLCCLFISDYVTWGPFLLYVPYKSWATSLATTVTRSSRAKLNWHTTQGQHIKKRTAFIVTSNLVIIFALNSGRSLWNQLHFKDTHH